MLFRSHRRRELNPLHALHSIFLLLLGVSLCEVLELVASFTTSPSSSKTEFVCIFFCVFEFGGFTGVSFIDRSNLSSLYSFYGGGQ